MKKLKKHNQNALTLLTSLSLEEFRRAEIIFENNETKNCSIYHKEKLLNKLKFIYDSDEETCHLFHKENNYSLEIPEASNPELIPLIIHYLYFKEIKALPFGEIINFLDLAIFFKIKYLIEKIINFLKENIDVVKTFELEEFKKSKQSEMKIGLLHYENDENTRSRSIRNISTFLIVTFLVCVIFLLTNEGAQQNVFDLKRIYGNKTLLHKNENDNALEDIENKIGSLENTIDNKQNNYEKKVLILQNEIGKKSEELKIKLDLIFNSLEKETEKKGETWKKDHDKILQKLKKKVEDLKGQKECSLRYKKKFEMHSDQRKKKKFSTRVEDKIEEQKVEGEIEKEKKWKKNALVCLNENKAALLCLKKREEEDSALMQLKSTIKTIDKDHEKHLKYMVKLFNLKNMSQLNTTLRLLFRASEHKWPLANKFHELCDGKGPTITIVRSEYNKLFGGYSSVSWNSNGFSSAPGSFLFSLDKQGKYIIDKNKNLGIRGDAKYGPSFGGSDLILSYQGSDLFDMSRPNWSNLGFTYSLPDGISFESDEAQSYLAGSYHFKVDEYEVFQAKIKQKKKKVVDDDLMVSLKSLFKTINKNHKKNFNYLAKLLNLKIDQLNTTPTLRLLFRASEHKEPIADQFHNNCDKEGPTITIVRSEYNKLFGGYASISWNSEGFSSAPGSFLFSLDNQTKHIINKNENLGLRRKEGYGPSFGGNDLVLSYKGSDLLDTTRPNWSNLGFTYSLPDGMSFESTEAQSYLAGSYRFKVDEYEVYKVIMKKRVKTEKEEEEEEEEKEKKALTSLKSYFKTINTDHEKHFKHLAKLLNLKSMDQLLKHLYLLFRASEHKWPNAIKFHELCDGKGPTITIVRSEYNKLFGGYSSISWHRNGWSSAPDSFLFSLDKQTKHIIDKNQNLAINGDLFYGPSFGGTDLVLSYQGSDLSDITLPNWSHLGLTYSLPIGMTYESDAAKSYLAGSYYFKAEEYEVFRITKEVLKEEAKAVDGAMTHLKSTIKTINEDYEKHFQYLIELLSLKDLDQLATTLRLLFRASEHENALADKFHEFCDGKGPTVILVRSDSNKLFGGYASISWHTKGDSYAPNSFLFSLDKQTKHAITRNEYSAIRGNAEYGPCFGESDLALSYKGFLNDIAPPNWSDLGNTYSLPNDLSFESNEAQSYLAGSYRFNVTEYEVFALSMDPKSVDINPPLIKLKSEFRTIEKDHKKHFKYLADLLNFKTLDELYSKLHLLFRASEHNFSKDKFHELCDGKGPTLTIIRSEFKKLFGGFATRSWSSTDGWTYAKDSFLFSLDKQTKHTLIRDSDYAIGGFKKHGIIFGFNFDLIICYDDNCTNSSNLGGTYSLPEGVSYYSGSAQSFLAGSHFFQIEEYEVFGVNMF